MKRNLSVTVLCTIVLASSVLLLTACASEPETEVVESEIERGIQEKAQAFSEAQDLITIGTPDTITQALQVISSSNLGTTDRGAELLFLSKEIYRIVYPYLEFPRREVPQLAETSLYRRLFAAVDKGSIPEVPEEEATFLTTLISAMVLLTANDQETAAGAAVLTERLLTINPQSYLAVFLRAYAQEKQGLEDAALERYREIIAGDPSCYPARIGVVRILAAKYQGEKALPQVELLLERFSAERQVAILAVEVFLQTGMLEQADDLLSAALSRYPEDSVLLRKRALLLERTGRTEQARRIIRIVEQQEGESAESLLLRVRFLEEQGQTGQALVEARNGIQRYPQALDLQIALAELLLVRDSPLEARDILVELREKLPDNSHVLSLLVDALIAGRQWQEARAQLEDLLQQRSGPQLLGKAVGVYRALGELPRALEVAERLVEEYPNQLDAVERYVRLLAEMDRRVQAIEYLQRRIEESQDSTATSRLFYLLSEMQTERDDRIRSLQSALFENMQNREALLQISVLYEQMGEYKKAVRYLRQAISLDPDNEDLKRRLRRIEQQIQ